MQNDAQSVYLVTGASRGIGAAVSAALDRRGASLFLVARGGIAGGFRDARVHRADLSHRGDVQDTLDAFVRFVDERRPGEITVINNAGVLAPIGPAHRCDPGEVAAAVSVNLLAPMLITGGFIRTFADRDLVKRVVNISSGAATSAYAGWNVYCATKAGVDHFTRCVGLEQEREKYPATVIALAPGVVDTDMQSQIRASNEDDFPMIRKFHAFKSSGSLPGADEAAGKLLHFLDTWPLEHGGVYDVRHAEA